MDFTRGEGLGPINAINCKGYGPVEIKETTILDSLKVIFTLAKKQEEDRQKGIEHNFNAVIDGKDRVIKALEHNFSELEEILNLIPDYKKELNLSLDKYFYRENKSTEIAKEWIQKHIHKVPIAEELYAKMKELIERIPGYGGMKSRYALQIEGGDFITASNWIEKHIDLDSKPNKNIAVPAPHIINCSKVFLPLGKKLVSRETYEKKKKIAGGIIQHTTIDIPDGFEIDKVILRKEVK